MTSASASRVPATRQRLDLFAYALMVVLCVAWGFQQVAIKMTAADLAPPAQLAIRFAGASIIFLVLVLAREGRAAFADGTLVAGVKVGVLFAMEFLLVGEALKFTTAAHAVVFLYTAPVFSALGLQILPEERLSAVQWIGIGFALAGIAFAFLGRGTEVGSSPLIGDAMALLGGVMWGLSTVVLRRSKLAGAIAAKTVAYQVIVAAILIGAYAIASGQAHMHVTPRLIANLVFQTLGIAVLSYLGWFWLLRHYLTSRLMLMALMTPIFGVVFGEMLLHETVNWQFIVGTLLVLGGIAVVNGVELLKPRN